MTKNTALDMTLELLKTKKSVTPAEINKHVGKGDYASKYICYLKNRGHKIETTKQGREIVGYKYLGLNASTQRVKRASQRGTVSTVKVVKAPKPVKKKPVKTAAPAKEKKVATKPVKEKVDEVEKTFGSTGAVSYNVDADWDAVDLSDFKALR